MNDRRTRVILSRILGVLAGFLLFIGILWSPSDPLALAQNRTVKVTLRICVTEQGKPIDLKPTLFNSPATIRQPDGGCYMTGPINLDPAQMYFVAATKPDLSGFAYAPVIVTRGDEGKTLTLNLEVHSRDNTPATVFEICLSSQNDQVALTDIKSRDGKPILASEVINSRCRQITAASASDLKLDLVAAVPPGGGLEIRWAGWAVAMLLLLLTVGVLTLTGWVLISVRNLTSKSATSDDIGQITGQLADLEKKFSERTIPAGASPPEVAVEPTPRFPGNEDVSDAPPLRESSDASPLTQSGEDAMQVTGSSYLEPAAPSARNDARALAQEQYQRFARGESVPHFYLMPSGASAANNMVEDLIVDLHERSNGTYVGFRSSAAEDEAWIFPMPGIHFTAEAFKTVFPDLTAESYENGSFAPRLVVRKAQGRWIPT